MQETKVMQIRSLGQEDLEKGMTAYSSIPAWEISWAEKPSRLQSMGSQRVGHNWATNTCIYLYIYLNVEKVLLAQSRPSLCNPMDCSPPGSSLHGLLQARILERVAISFSRGSSQPGDWTRPSALQENSLQSELQGKSLCTHKADSFCYKLQR